MLSIDPWGLPRYVDIENQLKTLKFSCSKKCPSSETNIEVTELQLSFGINQANLLLSQMAKDQDTVL